MKTIGLIGGMSWESSAVYYTLLNQKVRDLAGGLHSCKSIMITVDFAEIERLQLIGDWPALGQMMGEYAVKLEKAGADIVLLCANTMHLCSDAIIQRIKIPFLHIAQATGQEIAKHALKKVALLGTRYTMEKDFYKDLLTREFGLEVMIPEKDDRDIIHRTIYHELALGVVSNSSRQQFQRIIQDLGGQGAEGVILGCTEIPMLIRPTDVSIPVFDTAKIHAEKAVEWALDE